jgi:hypothetical protein
MAIDFSLPEERISEAVAAALASSDPHMSELISAEIARLREDSAENRARESALLHASAPHQTRYRAQFAETKVFAQNLTTIVDQEMIAASLYDDDLVSLVDGTGNKRDPWSQNTDATAALKKLLSGADRPRVRSIRLLLFEGTERVGQMLQQVHASELVTHLDLRRMREGDDLPVAGRFPNLRGLACHSKNVDVLLRDGAPELRSLVVRSCSDLPHLLELGGRLPKLRHLGIWNAPTQFDDVSRLVAHPLMNQLTSVEFHAINHTKEFPFKALLAQKEQLQYLDRLAVASHIVPPNVVERFADWSNLVWVSWDRREQMAFDFETIGWGANAR